MKRCNRFICSQNEPYLEFNFEKSLRKYEKIPHKRVKIDAIISRQDVLSVINNNEIVQRQISENSEQCGRNLFERDLQVLINNQQNLEQAGIPHIAQSELMENDIIKDSKLQQNGIQNLQEFISDDLSKPIIQQFLINSSDVSKEVELICQNQRQSEPIESVNFESFQESEDKISINKQQGGRFYISSNVSLSKRSIERLLKQKKTDSNIVDQLCKSRSYLQTMRIEIQQRLKIYRQGK